MLNDSMAWEKVLVSEAGEDMGEREEYFGKFEGKKKCSWSKVIQMNKTDLYIIGGIDLFASLLNRKYDVGRSCLKIDL
jgi:hypothetical protein